MAPKLTRKEEERLKALSDRHRAGFVNDEFFLADILLRTIQAMEQNDQLEQRERS